MSTNIRPVCLRRVGSSLCRIALVCLAACRTDAGSAEITRIAESECQALESDLDQAAARHHQLAAPVDENRLDPGQRTRAEADLNIRSVGTTPEVRHARVHEFELRYHFCLQIRAVDPKIEHDLTVRLEAIDEALNQNVWSGDMPTAAKTAELLGQFRDLVHDVNALPLKR